MAAPAGLGGGAAALLLLLGLVGELQRGDLVRDVVSVVHDGVGHDGGQVVRQVVLGVESRVAGAVAAGLGCRETRGCWRRRSGEDPGQYSRMTTR